LGLAPGGRLLKPVAKGEMLTEEDLMSDTGQFVCRCCGRCRMPCWGWYGMATVPADFHFVVKPFAWEDWRALWLVRFAQLGEEGIVLDPASISPQPQPELEDNPEWDFDHMDEVYLCGAGSFWLAWDASGAGHCSRPIGYVGAQDVGGVLELRHMYVQESYRRRGVGTALVQALIAHGRAQDVPAVELWTAPDGPGRPFYQTLGFRVTQRPRAEYKDVLARTRYTPGADEIRLRLELCELA
jgi:GNAT superfamily N-acetyltransferase